MSLPRPPSVFDATPLRGGFATVVPTGAPKRAAEEMEPSSGGDEGCDITECSDAEFDDWLGKQKPNIFAPDPAFEHKRFANEMMQIWMVLNTAATRAQVAWTDELTKYTQMPKRPEASDYGPQWRSLPGYDDPYENGISDWFLKQIQDEWQVEEDKRQALRKRPLVLLARAERVQGLISFA